MRRHLLRNIPEFDKNLVDKLAELWINSAEHFVSDTSSSEGLRNMAHYLNLTDKELIRIRETAKSYIAKSSLAELDSGRTERYPLGLRLKRQKKTKA
jgi:hypothetical protein